MKQKKRKRKDNKVIYLGKNRLDCIELLISQAIIDLQISHEEFEMIENQKENEINKGNKIELSENV